VQFTCSCVVRGGWFRREEFSEQDGDFRWPSGMVIATRNPGRPNLGLTLGTGAEVLAVKFIEARPGQAQFTSRFPGTEFLISMAGQEVTNDGSGQSFNQL
jgi:hypothetical protein